MFASPPSAFSLCVQLKAGQTGLAAQLAAAAVEDIEFSTKFNHRPTGVALTSHLSGTYL